MTTSGQFPSNTPSIRDRFNASADEKNVQSLKDFHLKKMNKSKVIIFALGAITGALVMMLVEKK